jgi:hypothetical protein
MAKKASKTTKASRSAKGKKAPGAKRKDTKPIDIVPGPKPWK